MTDGPSELPDGEAVHRPKPPLWQSATPEKAPSRTLLVFILLAILGVVVAGLGGESTFLATTSRPVEVTVARVDGVDPPDDAPAHYRYLVTLPDGAAVRYESPDVHHVGDRVMVMQSRGRITGRILLTRPRVTKDLER